MIERALETRVPPVGTIQKKRSAVMKLRPRGLIEDHSYPLVSPWSGCFFPVDQSHTANIAWTSLSQACSSHFGTDERLIRGQQRECCPPLSRFTAAWTLALLVIWTNVCRGRSVHAKTPIYTYTRTHRSPSPALSVSEVCVVVRWWAQLEFHTQLGSCPDGDWHVPVNPLHTALMFTY